MNKQLVLVEFRNTAPYVVRMVSAKKLTVDHAANWLDKMHGFDAERDAITFLDEPEEVRVDSRPKKV